MHLLRGYRVGPEASRSLQRNVGYRLPPVAQGVGGLSKLGIGDERSTEEYRFYSYLRAIIGSTREARRAGK